MIIYSIAAGGTVSVASLFMAGFIPGVLTGLCLMVAAYVVAAKRGYPKDKFPGFKALFLSFMAALPGLLTAVIIVGGVLSGVFTATESSAIAVIYALAVTVFFYRSLSRKDFITATLNAVKTTAMVLLIIGTAASFAWLLALNEVPAKLFHLLQSISDNPYVIMLLVNVILLFLGTFMDMSPLIIICTPIFLPVMKQLGMDPGAVRHRDDDQPGHRPGDPSRGHSAVRGLRRGQDTNRRGDQKPSGRSIWRFWPPSYW